MAMNKAERAELEGAKVLAALRWTAPVARDLPPPKDGYTEGWDINAHTGTASQAWSGVVTHGSGPAPASSKRHYSASQNTRALFSTKARALAAVRHEMERRFAVELRRVDAQLEAETSAQRAEPEGQRVIDGAGAVRQDDKDQREEQP